MRPQWAFKHIVEPPKRRLPAPVAALKDFSHDMLAAILEEQLQFLLGREATGRGRFPETEAVRTVSWFTGENHPVVAIAEGVGQEAGLGRFARPVDSFQDDEEAGVI